MNTITAYFVRRKTRTCPAYQYDYGQKLIIEGVDLPAAYEVHFSNSETGEAITSIGDETGVDIPDQFFLAGSDIYFWIFLHEGESDGETEYTGVIPIIRRAEPTDDEPTPVQQDAITQAIAALNVAVGETAADVLATAQSASDASTSASTAAAKATLAESWAVGGTGTRSGEDTNNAEFYATLAQQGAEESGFVWFNVDNTDGEMYVTITASLESDVSFEINTATGELEVTYA